MRCFGLRGRYGFLRGCTTALSGHRRLGTKTAGVHGFSNTPDLSGVLRCNFQGLALSSRNVLSAPGSKPLEWGFHEVDWCWAIIKFGQH